MDRQHIKFYPYEVHGEEIANNETVNSNSIKIVDDIKMLDNCTIDLATRLKLMDDNINIRLAAIKDKINRTKEIQQDMNILCNKYSDFASVLAIDESMIKGNLNIENGVFSLSPILSKKLDVKISSIDGNGYEGNKYVLIDSEFAEEIIDTKSYGNITDDAINTAFEYSRITTSDSEAPPIFNRDSANSSCVIELEFEEPANKITINSDRSDLVVNEILLSDDKITYKKFQELNVKINNRDDRYSNQEYIYRGGIIAIKPSKYVKILLSSSSTTSDTIGYVKTIFNDNEVIKKIEISNKSKRHCIRINDISAYSNKYSNGAFVTDELINDNVKCISLLCNEYIQEGYSIENNVNYFFIINGKEYEVTPLNSVRNGTKIIKMSSSSFSMDNVKNIEEEISSLKLKVAIKSSSQNVTPYISDLKVLIGG